MTHSNPVTGLDRAIDPRYPSNRFALGAAALGGVIALAKGATPLRALQSAAWTFSSWSLARELDPDDANTATLSAGATLVTLLAAPDAVDLAPVGLGVNATLVLSARSALNTTGRALTPGDQALVALAPLGAQALSGAKLGSSGVSNLSALVARGTPWWSVALAAAPVVSGLTHDHDDAPDGSRALAAGLLGLGALSALRPAPHTPADNGKPLEPTAWRWTHASVWAGGAAAALRVPALALGALIVTGAVGLVRELGASRKA
jgi:hypothetical protein